MTSSINRDSVKLKSINNDLEANSLPLNFHAIWYSLCHRVTLLTDYMKTY